MNVEVSGLNEIRKFVFWGDLPVPCLIMDSNDGEIRLISNIRDDSEKIIITPLNDNDGCFLKSALIDKSVEIPQNYQLLENYVKIKLSNGG